MVSNQVERVVDGEVALVAVRNGLLRIWQRPVQNLKYCAGVDTASGSIRGDYNVMALVEVNSGDLVAAMRGRRESPDQWGRICAYLAWYYNTALLGFETHPSQHGLAACIAARDEGYPMLYRRAQVSSVQQGFTHELGWATTSKTKQLLISSCVQAIAAGCKIPDEVLIQELLTARYEADGELGFEGNDDYFVAYAIAQQVRRHAISRGFVSTESPTAVDFTQAWWKHRQAQWDRGTSGAGKRPRLWNGI